MLLTLLWFVASVNPVFLATYVGSILGGVLGALIGFVVGLVIGLGSFFGIGALRKALKRWRAHFKEQRRSPASVERLLGLVYLGVFLWIIASELLGMYITRFV